MPWLQFNSGASDKGQPIADRFLASRRIGIREESVRLSREQVQADINRLQQRRMQGRVSIATY
jgi:hypothetical protein